MGAYYERYKRLKREKVEKAAPPMELDDPDDVEVIFPEAEEKGPDHMIIKKAEKKPPEREAAETPRRTIQVHRESEEDSLYDEWEPRSHSRGEQGKDQQPASEPTDKRQRIYLDVVLDGTYSFSWVFLPIYCALEKTLYDLREARRNKKGVLLQYGLTVFHEKPENVMFAEDSFFTESEDEFLKALRKIRFYGGGEDGRENLTEALDQGLRILNNTPESNAYRGLLLFTDSLPRDGNSFPDFTKWEQKEYQNKGLRIAQIYSYDGTYMPRLKMVDRNGQAAENKNTASYGVLGDLVSVDQEVFLKRIGEMVKSILYQASV